MSAYPAFADTMPVPVEETETVEQEFVAWLDANHPAWRSQPAANAPFMRLDLR